MILSIARKLVYVYTEQGSGLKTNHIWVIFQWGNGRQNGTDPFRSEKKIVRIIGFKSTGFYSRFQRKNQFWKRCTESRDIGQNVSNFAVLVWKANFEHFFGNILGLSAYFSKPIFLLWNRESESLNLNTMTPIIRTCLFSLLKGSEPFCWPLPHRKMTQIWLFESRSLFSIYKAWITNTQYFSVPNV